MKLREAIKIIQHVNDNDGALSLHPDDPSFDWLEAKECVRRHEQRRARKGEPAVADDEVVLTVRSNLEPRSGMYVWEASPLIAVVGSIVEKVLREEEGVE